MQSILVADDDDDVLAALSMLLRSEGFKAVTVNSPEQAMSAFKKQNFSLILIDLNFSLDTTSGDEGLKLISSVREHDEFTPIVVMTGWATVELAVSTMKIGANDFVQKPWENERLIAIVNNQIKLAGLQVDSRKLIQQNELLLENESACDALVAESAAMQEILRTIVRVSNTDASILLTGENGTGKSLLARHIHELSPRSTGPLISVNMGGITEPLFESEMFGHQKGAFTDAKTTRIGRFELADKGTLFFDEIANTPISQQAKLLRVLEEKKFEKVGSEKTQSVNFRLISATNSNLSKLVDAEAFRKDLLYRINTFEIELPPLRDRVEDIVPLAYAFLRKAAKKNASQKVVLSSAAESLLEKYAWPGNVRELEHVMERAQILCSNGIIEKHDFGIDANICKSDSFADSDSDFAVNLKPFSVIENDIVNQRLSVFNGDAVKAAESLGLSRSAFYRRLSKLKDLRKS